MCTKNSADREEEEQQQQRDEDRCALGAWEGKIKGRGTSARASHGLHMGFSGTPVPRRVPYTTLVVAIARDLSACAPLKPVGVP